MYAGRPIEQGTRDQVFTSPLHPYALGLLSSVPRVDRRVERLVPNEGRRPSLINVPSGCAFHPRCPYRFEPCDTERPELRDRGGGHADACHLSADQKAANRRERLDMQEPVA